MKLYIYTIIAVLLSLPAQGRQNEELRKGNYQYTHLAYHEALEHYLKVMPFPNDAVALSRVGDCYRLTKDAVQANAWYARAAALPGCPPAARLAYAQTLMTTGNYAEALPQLQQYIGGHPNDRRAANMAASCTTADSMQAKMPTGFAQLLGFNTDGSDFGPALKRGELYFTSDTVMNSSGRKDKWSGKPYYNIYKVDNSMVNAFGTPQALPGRDRDQFHDGPCAFSGDGSMLYFTRTSADKKFFTTIANADKQDVVRLQIMIATDYNEDTRQYETLMPFPYNNRDYSVAHPTVSKDDTRLFFVSDMKGGAGGTDIYMCEKQSDGSWGAPKNMGMSINTEGNELFPYVDLDYSLYFASDGHIGYGGLDIYKAAWNDSTRSYDAPVNMGMPVNSSYDDMSLTFTLDGAIGYFASDRPAAKKGDNVYSYTPHSLYLNISGVDATTGTPVTDYKVTLLSPTDSSRMVPAADGNTFVRLYPQIQYDALVTAPHYQPQHIVINSNDTARPADTIFTKLKFDPHVNVSLNLMVYDEAGDTSIKDARIAYYKTGQYKADTVALKEGGQYVAALDADNTYHFIAIKNNYAGAEKVVSTNGIKPEAGRVNLVENLYLKRQE